MPISDNECDDYDMEYGGGAGSLDYGSGQEYGGNLEYVAGGPAMSKAEQRRSNKPIMEKRRRARINHCLNELKSLILEAMKKDPARHSKLEKADILEMTVKHLQNVQRQQLSQAVSADPHTLHKFKNGFNECATEVSRYVSRLEGVDGAVRQRLVAHLSGCVQGLQQIAPFSFSGLAGLGGQGLGQPVNPQGLGQGIGGSVLAPSPSVLQQVQLSGDINNNNSSNGVSPRVPSLQLIPSRLPTGELALLLPGSGQLSSQLSAKLLLPTAPVVPGDATSTTATTPIIKATPHASAFTAVGPAASTPVTPPSSLEPVVTSPDTGVDSAADSAAEPDTPPSSARALQLARVAADSSTPSTPENYPPSSRGGGGGGRPSTDSGTSTASPTSTSVAEAEAATLTPRAPHCSAGPAGLSLSLGPRSFSALDFSLKRSYSDSESEVRAHGLAVDEPRCKVPRYTLSVTSSASSPLGVPGLGQVHPLRPPQGLHASAHAADKQGEQAEQSDRDMWRPW